MGEAVAFVTDIFRVQIQDSQGAEPNAAIDGDSAARSAFHTLLPQQEQRQVFLRFCKNSSFWPRVRSLVGSPPFSFLFAEDEGILRAGGVARGRVNLSKASIGGDAASHFLDDLDRRYSVVQVGEAAKNRMAMPLPFASLEPGVKVVIDVRIKKRKHSERERMLRDGRRRMLTFPNTGEIVLLQPHAKLQNATVSRTITVKSVELSSKSVMTARLLCVAL